LALKSVSQYYHKKERDDPMATQEQATVVDGWEFQLVNDRLSIRSQSDPAKQVQLSPQAAFGLLSYLSKHRDNLYWATQQEEPEPDQDLHPHPDEEDPGF
jgi:hypothetical protein